MNHPLLLLSLLLLTGFGHSFEPAAQGRGRQTATVQILPSPALPYTERFIGNQMALLTTGPILKPASEACGVDAKTIAASLKLQRIKDSDLLTISSLHDDKNQRHRIVTAVLNSYLDHRKQLDAALTGEKLKGLEEEIGEANELKGEKRNALIPLIGNYGIPHFEGAGTNSLEKTEQEMFRKAREKLAEFETRRDQIEIQVQKMATLKDLELVKYSAGLDLPNNQVTDYHTRYRTALDDRSDRLANGLGKTHPNIKALDAKASGALKNALKETVSLNEVLQTHLELLNRQIERMKEMVKARKTDAGDLSQRQQEYNLAKAAYENSREQLRNLKLRQEELRTALKNTRHLIIHGWGNQ